MTDLKFMQRAKEYMDKLANGIKGKIGIDTEIRHGFCKKQRG